MSFVLQSGHSSIGQVFTHMRQVLGWHYLLDVSRLFRTNTLIYEIHFFCPFVAKGVDVVIDLWLRTTLATPFNSDDAWVRVWRVGSFASKKCFSHFAPSPPKKVVIQRGLYCTKWSKRMVFWEYLSDSTYLIYLSSEKCLAFILACQSPVDLPIECVKEDQIKSVCWIGTSTLYLDIRDFWKESRTSARNSFTF